MTDIDTSPEAVEREASWLENCRDVVVAVNPKSMATLLRQLAKERDEARNAALEEARQVAWRLRYETGADVYNAIRLLKTPQTGVDLNAKAIGLAVDFTTGTAREVYDKLKFSAASTQRPIPPKPTTT